MNKGIRFIKYILLGTILSLLVFCTISFIDYIIQLPPISKERIYIEFGLPFSYYNEVCNGNGDINFQWNMLNLICDFIITWLIVCCLYIIFRYCNKIDFESLNEE